MEMEQGGSPTSPLGSLATRIAATLKPADSIPRAFSPTSTPGPRMPQRHGGGNAMPVPSGRAGAGAMPIVPQVTLPAVLQAALGSPDKVDLALRDCLPPRLKSSLSMRYATTRRGSDDDDRPLGFEPTRALDPAEAGAVLAWLDVLDRRFTRADLVQEVTRCLAVTAAREREHADLKAMLAVMADELCEFPADVIRAALRNWARREKWWPTLSDLRARCERAMRLRRSLRLHCARAVVEVSA